MLQLSLCCLTASHTGTRVLDTSRMARRNIFATRAQRLLRVRNEDTSTDEPFPVDEIGFLIPPARLTPVNEGSVNPGEIVRPDAVVREGVLVLLGEPGSGKSTVFDAIIDEMGKDSARCSTDDILRIDGASLTESTFEKRLLNKLPGHVRRSGSAGVNGCDCGSCKAYIMIDQLDESPALNEFPNLLSEILDHIHPNSFHLLIACRTADFPRRTIDVLRARGLACILSDLAPLTRSQAAELASSAGIDGEALIAATLDAGAGALATTPLALEMLVRAYQRHDALPPSANEIFAAGVRYLAEEPDNDRISGSPSRSAEEILLVASLIATHMIFTGRRTLWWGREMDAAETDFLLSGIINSVELVPGGELHISRDLVKATVATALFTGRDGERVAFCHSTIAAYLAATYLRGKHLPPEQARSLFLVQLQGTTNSIPPQLRETAAWLASLDPNRCDWLARADPLSLASHSFIVDSTHIRRLIVQSMLDHADEVVLTDNDWRLKPSALSHPSLASQLKPILAAAGTEWSADEKFGYQARLRLAVRLSEACEKQGLLEDLVNVAVDDRQQPHLRRMAMRTAFAESPSLVADKISAVLALLQDDDYAQRTDPLDEVRATIIDLLYPDYLRFADAAPHLLQQVSKRYFGAYFLLQSRVGDLIPQRDVRKALEWANDIVSAQFSVLDSQLESAGNEQIAITAAPTENPTLNRYLTESLAERGLIGPYFDQRSHLVSSLVCYAFRQFGAIRMPKSISERRKDGTETKHATTLRRKLAWSIVLRAASFDRPEVRGELYALTALWDDSYTSLADLNNTAIAGTGRRRLLDSRDFGWIVGQFHAIQNEVNGTLLEAIGVASSSLFDPADLTSVELAEDLRDTALWPYLQNWFDAIDLRSLTAQHARRAHELETKHEREHVENRSNYIQHTSQMLEAALDGDDAAFSLLVWNLQFDPATLRGPVQFDDDARSYPGWEELGTDSQELFVVAALQYLSSSHDDYEQWLGTNRYYRSAWAGYVALALIERMQLASKIPAEAWGHWCGAVLWFPCDMRPESLAMKRRLLLRLLHHSSSAIAAAFITYIERSVEEGNMALELRSLIPEFAAEHAESVLSALDFARLKVVDLGAGSADEAGSNEPDSASQSLNAARDVWHRLVDLLESMEVFRERALEIAHEALTSEHLEVRKHLGPLGAVTLVRENAQNGWAEILKMPRERFVDLEIIAHIANTSDTLDLGQLSEEYLLDIYEWADTVLPSRRVEQVDHATWISDDRRSRDWCDSLLYSLAEKGSRKALDSLSQLTEKHPQDLMIKAHLLKARMIASEKLWSPPGSDTIFVLIGDATRRLVRSSRELAEVVLATIETIQDGLHTHCELLWDEISIPTSGEARAGRTSTWRPKPEAALCAYIAHELELRLANRGVIVNREVLVKPTNAQGAGERTDILVDAILTTKQSWFSYSAIEHVRVVIELKGNWNDEIDEAMRTQLTERYLPDVNTDSGIFLVGWYPLDLWTTPGDRRRTKAAKRNEVSLLAALREQAAELISALAVFVEPVLLRVERPIPASQVSAPGP